MATKNPATPELVTTFRWRSDQHTRQLSIQYIRESTYPLQCNANQLKGFTVDKTTKQRQKRYREQITKGDKKRLKVVLNREEADKLDNICSAEGVSKTAFLSRLINQYKNSRDS